MTIHIPRAAEEIIDKLNKHGFEAYVVGGCVRDALLGREPGDWDITTSAKPEQVKEIFGRTIDTGIRHGTVTILRGRVGYEVTTYRIDGEYGDGRHPDSVEFTSNLAEDLKRRDFTMNAMAYSSRDGLVDVFDGLKDIRERRIRCVGLAEERFTEDALRILRALRFSAQLDFAVESGTQAAIRKLAPNLVHVSRERIAAELTKLLLSDHPDRMKAVFDCGAAPFVSETFSQISPDRIAVGQHIPAVKWMRWAAFLRHQKPESAERILRELKFDNDTISRVGVLTEWWNRPAGGTQAELRRTMSRIGPELYDGVLLLKEAVLKYYGAADEEKAEFPPDEKAADGAGCGGRSDEEKAGCGAGSALPAWDFIPETWADLQRIREDTRQIRARGDCISLKTLAVTGGDLIAAGMKPGRQLGETLSALLELVLEHPEKNEKEILLKAAAVFTA